MMHARRQGLTCIPEPIPHQAGTTVLVYEQAQWDLCTWQPGMPGETLTPEQVGQSVRLLSQLHACWKPWSASRIEVCPAIHLQHQRLTAWTLDEMQTLERTLPRTGILRLAFHHFQQRRVQAVQQLQPWLRVRLPLQLCLGDIWREHLLFTDEQLTGLIDFGGVRYDTVAQDLARLFGSLPAMTAEQRDHALSHYVGLSTEWARMARLLEQTGLVVGLGNWLRWLVIEKRPLAEPARVEARLIHLVKRLSDEPVHYFP